MRILKLFSFILLLTPMLADALPDDAVASFSANIVPNIANQNVDDIPGSNNLDDGAYQFQASFTWGKKSHLFAKSEREFIAVRAFKFIERYEEEGAEGASAIEGIALLYGQRYMLTSETYDGLGVGWYGGLAFGTDTYVEQGFNTTPIEEDLFAPLVFAEAFYRHTIDQFFVEASGVVGLNKTTDGVTFVPGIFAGIEF